MWFQTLFIRNGTWFVSAVPMILPVVSLTRPKTGSGSACPAGLAVKMLFQPVDLAAIARRACHRLPEPADRLQRPGHGPVTAGGVLDQHRQRPLDPLHRLAPVLQAVLERHPRGHVPAVHDQPLGPDRRGGLELLVEQLPAGDPDPVVAGRHVDDVGRVDVDVHPGGRVGVPDGGRVPAGYHRALPALRIAEEELGRVRPAGSGLGQRVGYVKMASDAHCSISTRLRAPFEAPPSLLAPSSLVGPVGAGALWLVEGSEPRPCPAGSVPGRIWAQPMKPPLLRPMARPTKPAMMPATMSTRCWRVDETICRYRPRSIAARPVAVAMMCTAGLVCAFRTTRPSTNDTRPATRVKMVSAFSTGCGRPSEFKMRERGPLRSVPATMTTSWSLFQTYGATGQFSRVHRPGIHRIPVRLPCFRPVHRAPCGKLAELRTTRPATCAGS